MALSAAATLTVSRVLGPVLRSPQRRAREAPLALGVTAALGATEAVLRPLGARTAHLGPEERMYYSHSLHDTGLLYRILLSLSWLPNRLMPFSGKMQIPIQSYVKSAP